MAKRDDVPGYAWQLKQGATALKESVGWQHLFEELAIEALEKEWKTYPVFHMDFDGGNFTKPDVLRERICYYLSAWEQE
ncbi:MAG: AAA family ATPase [Phocaeicola plebeius]